MARTAQQIDTEILAALNSTPALAALNSTSQVSLWKLFKDAIASVLLVNDQLADVQQATLQAIADSATSGTAAWLQRKVLDFQYGDTVRINPNFSATYPTHDPAKQLITRCSVKQFDDTRIVLVKVAKGTTTLAPLTALELSALKAYLAKVKHAGTIVRPISLEADRMIANIEIYYDGQYIQATVQAAVIAAVNGFLQNLEFDGTMYLSKLEDALQQVIGVKDIVLKSIIARPYTTALNDPGLVPIERLYETNSGYLVPETAPGYGLADTISLIAV